MLTRLLFKWLRICQEPRQATGTTDHDDFDTILYATAQPNMVPSQSTQHANEVTTSQASSDGLHTSQAIPTCAAVDFSKKTSQKPKSDTLKAIDMSEIEVHIAK